MTLPVVLASLIISPYEESIFPFPRPLRDHLKGVIEYVQNDSSRSWRNYHDNSQNLSSHKKCTIVYLSSFFLSRHVPVKLSPSYLLKYVNLSTLDDLA